MVDVYIRQLNETVRTAVLYLIPVPAEKSGGDNVEYIVSEISDNFKSLFTGFVCEFKGKKISDILSEPFSSYDYYHVISDAFSMSGPDSTDFYSELSGRNYSVTRTRRHNKEIIITIAMVEKAFSSPSVNQPESYNLFIENMADAIWECDIKGYVTGVRSLNYSERSVDFSVFIGNNINGLIQAKQLKQFNDFFRNCLNETIKTGKNFLINYSSEKRYCQAETLVIPYYTDDGSPGGFYGVVKKSEEILYATGEESGELCEMNDVCSQIGPVSYLSHEIRTPLNSILGFSKLLEMGVRLNGEQQNYISHIQNCSRHILSVVNSILDLSKIENGSAELECREFIINNVINDAIAIVSSVASEHNNSIIFDPSGFSGKKYCGDAGKLKQVIINLLGNASKFTNNGKVTVELKSLSETADDEKISVTISDSGSGIAWDKIDSIFKPFFGSSQKMKNKNSGAGIGLPLSNAIVKLMGGSGISVESRPGAGSKFSFNLSLKKAQGNLFKLKDETACNISGAETRHRILVVEDDRSNSYLIGCIFELLNIFEYTIANSGTEALKLVASNDFDVILMDLNIPDINGIDITRIIRQSNIKVPIIAITGDVTETVLESCYDAGMNGFISKPFVMTELINKINANLNRGKKRINFSALAGKMIS